MRALTTIWPRSIFPRLSSSMRLNIPIQRATFSSLKSTLSDDMILDELSSNFDFDPDLEITHSGIKGDFSNRIIEVKDVLRAREIVEILEHAYKQEGCNDVVWACDTETTGLNLKTQSPVGNGKVLCVSIYGGPNVDFGVHGKDKILWIENTEDGQVLRKFKSWFENENHFKVWHNYGFDRHVMYNENINCRGFLGDTMHMARLFDSSRDKASGGGREGYSLESLTKTFFPEEVELNKTPMKELFGVAKTKKDGTASKVKIMPDTRALQESDSEMRADWIQYSAKDAYVTWRLHQSLVEQLKGMKWIVNYEQKPKQFQDENVGLRDANLFDYYMNYMAYFAEVLTDMERIGIKVDTKVHLREAEKRARDERQKFEDLFLQWAKKYCKDAEYINPASSAQLTQLLFGEYGKRENSTNPRDPPVLFSDTRVFKIEKRAEDKEAEEKAMMARNPYVNFTIAELKATMQEKQLKTSGKRLDLMMRLLQDDYLKANPHLAPIPMSAVPVLESNIENGEIDTEVAASSTVKKRKVKVFAKEVFLPEIQDLANSTGKVSNHRELIISTIGLKPIEFTPKGAAKVSTSVLNELAGKRLFEADGKDAVWGAAYDFLGRGPDGEQACKAIGALAAIGQVDATITNFLVPLQALVDDAGRIHCSLNLNTETGRLSSRRPNLQNQPALEKDQYKIRDAFVASEGNTLIVADYGQLELRILAHITKCASMIEAFKAGGCFHSRTAVGMYPYIKAAVDSGEVILEWDYSKGQPTCPLVKDTYGSERRKAKTLNFSIAYGKTVKGLANDWAIDETAAQETLDAWYRDRPEVKEWQEKTRAEAKRTGMVRTIMGRYRKLPDAMGKGSTPGSQGHALRAAINTPIQGSAADIVMMAMVKLWNHKALKQIGWKLLLQIHDEVILEGPKETKDEAMTIVRKCMEDPFDAFLPGLLVHLDVDAKSADSWYKAK